MGLEKSGPMRLLPRWQRTKSYATVYIDRVDVHINFDTSMDMLCWYGYMHAVAYRSVSKLVLAFGSSGCWALLQPRLVTSILHCLLRLYNDYDFITDMYNVEETYCNLVSD
jgi:hypothetical protein